MSDAQLVSIIIPTYKSGDTLKVAIDSALDQTYQNIEVIIVDDNNPNTVHRLKTESIMELYKNNSRIKYIQHKKNKNGSAARNTGFRKSSGEYICFLDDDDVFLKNKVQKQVDYLEKNEQFDAVYCWRFQNGEVVKYKKTGNLSEELLTLSYTPYTSSIMLRRHCYVALNGFDETYRRHQDYEFILRFFESHSIGVINEPLLKIIGNQVDNTLRGKDLESLKNKFLNQFSEQINRIDKKCSGFRKLVYSRHYSSVFWSYFKQFEFFSAFRIFIIYSFRGGLTFWMSLFRYLKAYLKVIRIK